MIMKADRVQYSVKLLNRHGPTNTHNRPLRCVLLGRGNRGAETSDINPQQQVLNNVAEWPHTHAHKYLPTPVF